MTSWDAVWESLDERRRLWAEGREYEEYFYTSIRGGRWTATHKGLISDSICGQARGGIAREFCKCYAMNVMATYAFEKFGEHIASILAVEWCSRMAHFFTIWMARDSLAYQFTVPDWDSYIATEDFIIFLSVGLGFPSYG